jgi:hypothetical protein
MASTEQIDALMAEIGALLKLQEVTGFAARNAWTLQVDDDLLLFADHDPGQSRIVLSGEVATPLPSSKAAVHELLLQYNGQWKETGGVRMALDGPDGAVVQICDISTVNLDAATFAGAVQVFADVLRGWRDMLSREPSDCPQTAFDLLGQGVIRG